MRSGAGGGALPRQEGRLSHALRRWSGCAGLAREVCDAACRGGPPLETAGPHDEGATVLPPLPVADERLEQGLGMPDEAVASVVGVRTLAA
ncbi:hypothetical protein [Streptomyces altiplanensis]